MLDVAARLIPTPFYFFGEQIRAVYSYIQTYQAALESAQRNKAEDWIIATYQIMLDQVRQAYSENRGLTGPIAACNQYNSRLPPSLLNLPAATVYTKPFIVLVDEFSISAADIFPAMIQDNARAPLVGMRTNGGGGSTSSWPPGVYSECLASNTNTLVWRKNPIVTPEYPTANYVENIGARPDVPLDYMTRENLLSGGRVFVQAFTRIVTDWIRADR